MNAIRTLTAAMAAILVGTGIAWSAAAAGGTAPKPKAARPAGKTLAEAPKAKDKARWTKRKPVTDEQRRKFLDARKQGEQAEAEGGSARRKYLDQRQEWQARRIEHGINKGYLTADELAKLDAQQKAIADMETAFRSDGRLTRDEMTQLRGALNTASRCIWGEKHDTEGNQMPAYVFGGNVFAKSELTAMMSDENLSAEQARALMKDFRRMMDLKRTLATGDLSDEQRQQFQAEFNELLNRYFEVRPPTTTAPAEQ